MSRRLPLGPLFGKPNFLAPTFVLPARYGCRAASRGLASDCLSTSVPGTSETKVACQRGPLPNFASVGICGRYGARNSRNGPMNEPAARNGPSGRCRPKVRHSAGANAGFGIAGVLQCGQYSVLRTPRPRRSAGRAVAAGLRPACVDRLQASGAAIAGGARQSISAVMAIANAKGKSHGSHSWLEAGVPRHGGSCASGARAMAPKSWHARPGADMCLPGCSVA